MPPRGLLVPSGYTAALLAIVFATAAIFYGLFGDVLPWPSSDVRIINVVASSLSGRLKTTAPKAGPAARPTGSISPMIAVADPPRVRSLLPVGSTHLLHTKGGMTGTLQPGFQWGFRRRLRAAYAFESLVHRTIESNDGARIVEVRRFEKVRMVRLLSESQNMEIDLGLPEKEILEPLGDANCVGTRRVDPCRLADAILVGGAKAIQGHATNRAYVQTDSLSGKTVRITYVDGLGVTSVEPIDCTLAESDRQFLQHTPVLADAYLAPNTPSRSSEPMDTHARQLACLLAPSLRKVPQGEFRLDPIVADRGGQPAAIVRLSPDPASPPTWTEAVPTGTVSYDPQLRRIQSLMLEGSYADFEHCLSYPEECNWHMSLYPRANLRFRLCYYCGSAGEQRKLRGAPRQIRSGGPFAGLVDGAGPHTGHTAGLGWQGPTPLVEVYDDLGVARLILLVAAVGCFRCGMRIARHGPRLLFGATVAAVVAATFLFGVFAHGQLQLAEWAPVSSIIVLGNFLPLGAAFLIGVLGGHDQIPVWRRAALILFLATSAGYTLAASFPATDPGMRHLWSLDGVSLQTGSASCSACAAATLLADYGIPANEQEMAELCLTRSKGTPILGLFRGLKLKTRQSGWDVEVFRCGLEELRREGRFPVLLPVRVGEISVVNSNRKRVRVSQMRARSHAVVLFGFTEDGRAEIGDPSRAWDNGRVLWPADELQAAYCGEGLRLVQR